MTNLIPVEDTHQLSRPRTPEKKYTTFTDFDIDILIGSGGQNPINAGSSMFNPGSDPQMEPRIRELISSYIDTDSYLLKYNSEVPLLARINSLNLIRFRTNKQLRKHIISKIFIEATMSFRNNIYPGYAFILVSLYFMIEKSYYKTNDKRALPILSRYFTNEADFNEKILAALHNAEQIENLNAFCSGRFYFVDDKLSDYNDFKPTQQKIIELLIE